MKLSLRDMSCSFLICLTGIFMAYGLPNAMIQGWTIISAALFLIGLSLFQSYTVCSLCKLDVPHTMPECFSERLKKNEQPKSNGVNQE